MLCVLLGVTLVAVVAALGLTRAQPPKVETPVVVDEATTEESDITIDSSIDHGFATASAMPETTDKERVAKYKAFHYLFYPPKNFATNEKIRAEQIRIAQAIEQKGIRAAELLQVARQYADEGQWTKYMAVVDALQPPFRELGIAYYHAVQDMKDGNSESAMKRFQSFENRIKKMPEGFEQATASLFCFISLGKLGFTDEIAQYVKKTFKSNWEILIDHDEETNYGFYIFNEFSDAIGEIACYLNDHGEKDKAFDLALELYAISCGNSGHIMNQVIDRYVKEDQIDKALELTQKIKTALGRETQWETYLIFQTLLKKDEYDKALKIAQGTESFNELVQKQMYFELMEYLLNHDEKDKCAVLLDEALEKSAKQPLQNRRLTSFSLFMKIAVKWNDPWKIELVMSEAQKHLDKIMGDEWNEYPAGDLERTRVHSLCDYAEVRAAAGKIDDAKATFQQAIRQTEKVDDKFQANYALHGVARSQTSVGFIDDAFETAKRISDKVIETETYWNIGALIGGNDLPNAKRALVEAQKGISEINDSRVFGLVNSLEQRIADMEKKTLSVTESDTLVFTDGQWTNEKTGEVIPDGCVVQGTQGTFRLEQEDGTGKVVKLSGDGATGQAKYVKLTNGGNAITVSSYPFEYLDELHQEFEKSGVTIGEDDVFVFAGGQWKNETTGDVIPTGTLVAGTGGMFRLETLENGDGTVTPVVGGGAIGHGKYIRWSGGGNGISISADKP
ncbi:MAG: tetratricopeptide repeat protein [Planctomycetaceae bacterium]|nr:tetratricopeptide repeat protein [Planctomycetaceae bacterium]